jgi:hypothetical protein
MSAINKMQKAAADPEVCAIMEYREKSELDHINRMKNPLSEGEMLGKLEGIQFQNRILFQGEQPR